MKYKIYNQLKVSLAVISIAIAGLFFLGCESDDRQASFENNSTHRVTLYVQTFEGMPASRQTLEPGAKVEIDAPADAPIKYDWEPKSRVNARDVGRRVVVFENK